MCPLWETRIRRCTDNAVKSRLKTRSYKRECKFGIKLKYEAKTKKLVVKEFQTEHNHPCNQRLYAHYPQNRKPNKQEEDTIISLLELGADKQQVLKDYVEKTEKLG